MAIEDNGHHKVNSAPAVGHKLSPQRQKESKKKERSSVTGYGFTVEAVEGEVQPKTSSVSQPCEQHFDNGHRTNCPVSIPLDPVSNNKDDGDEFFDALEFQPVDQPGFFGRIWSGTRHWVGHFVEMVTDHAVKPVFNKVVENQEAITEVAQQVENKTRVGEVIYRIAASYLAGKDPGKDKPMITVPDQSQALEATARLLNVLTVGFSASEGIQGCTEDNVILDEVIIGDAAFKSVKASIKRLENGNIEISELSFHLVPHKDNQALASNDGSMTEEPGLYERVDLALKSVEISCPLPSDREKQATAVAAAVFMQPGQAARGLCEAFCPEQASITIGQVKSIIRGCWLEGSTTDEVGFCLENASLEVHTNRDFYPGLTPEITVNPGNITADIKSDGFISEARAKIDINDERSGTIKTEATLNLAEFCPFLKPLGKLQVNSTLDVKEGVILLRGLDKKVDLPLGNRFVRFLVKPILNNTLKSRYSGLKLKDGKSTLQLQLSVLSEEGYFSRWPWLVHRVNRWFAPYPIEIPLPLCGLRPMEQGKKGLGYLVIGDMGRGMIPCGYSLRCRRHENLLQNANDSLRQQKLNGYDPAYDAASRLLAEAEEEQKRYNFSAEESLYRRIPLPATVAYVNYAKAHPEDPIAEKRLLRLLAVLADVMPNKALQLIKATSASEGFPFAGQSMVSMEDLKNNEKRLLKEKYFLINFLMKRRESPEPDNASIEELQEFRRQTGVFRDLLFSWNTAQKSHDGSAQDLTRPDTTPEAGKAIFEELAHLIKAQWGNIAQLIPAGILLRFSPVTGVAVVTALSQQFQKLERPKSNAEKFAEVINGAEENAQYNRRKQQEAKKGYIAQAMGYAGDFVQAVLPEPLEQRTLEYEQSRRVLEQDLALAGMKRQKVIANETLDEWVDSRYWRVVGAQCNSGHCSIHEASMAVMGTGRYFFHSRLAYLSNLLELTAGGHDIDKAVRSFFMEAPKPFLQEMVAYYTQNSENPSANQETVEAYKNLHRLAEEPVGDLRQQLINDMAANNTSWLLRDMIRPCHRVQENRACREIMSQVEETQRDAQALSEGKTGQERKEIAAWCDEQCEALLSILPLERMSEQLSRARSVGDNMGHSQAHKYFMPSFHRDELEDVLCKAYGMVARYAPEKVVPGVLDRQHENHLLCALSHQAKENDKVRELLQTHLLCRVILDKTGRMMKPGETISFEAYLKGVVGILAGYTSMITSSPLGGGLLLKAIGAGYAASFGRDATDSRYCWADQLSDVLSAGKNKIWSLLAGDQGPESFEAAVAELCQGQSPVSTELSDYSMDSKPIVPTLDESSLQMSLTNQNMIDLIRTAFSGSIRDEQMLQLIKHYIRLEREHPLGESSEVNIELQEAMESSGYGKAPGVQKIELSFSEISKAFRLLCAAAAVV